VRAPIAAEQVERQKKDFIRLGVLGDWDNPYLTMAFRNEADEIRALGDLYRTGYLFKGLKPVNWCFDCGSALAEAEVEYQDKKSPAIDVGFRLDASERERVAHAFGIKTLPDGDCWTVIWTTTPWTIPSNQALNMHPEFTYELVRDGARLHHPCRRVARGGTAALRPRRRGARRLPGRGAGPGEVPPSLL
jgi:isoleucyl-tRNA synthetase